MSEADAEGSVADLYEDIRRTLRLPLVNLIYRHLAAIDRLEGVWAALRPNLVAPAIEGPARELAAVDPGAVAAIPCAALAAAGVGDDELARAHATLAAYAHANSRNLLAITGALRGTPGSPTSGPAPTENDNHSQRDPAEVLPMAALGDLDGATRRLLDEMSRPVVGDAEPVIVPSLLRHFAHRPCLLALLWTAIRPGARDVAAKASAIRARAEELAAGLPHPVAALEDEEARAPLERFRPAMSGMLVVGAMLERALAEA